jgi:hypothetical protein
MKQYLTILFFFSVACYSQSWEVGFNAGAVRSHLKEQEPTYNHKYLYGLSLEGNVGYFFTPYIGVGSGLMYDQRGYSISGYSGAGDFYDNDIHYDYLSIPVKVSFNSGKSLFISASLGANFSILIASKTIDVSGMETVKKKGAFDFSGFAEMRTGYRFKNGFALFCQIKGQPSLFTSFASDSKFGDFKHRIAVLSIGANFQIQSKAEPIN